VIKLCALLCIIAILAPAAMVHGQGEFDWKQESGKTIRVLFMRHGLTDALKTEIPAFEAATGIKVNIDILSESEFFDKALIDLSTAAGTYDAIVPVPTAIWQYAGAGWLQPLEPFVNDPKLTAADWDFKDFWPSLIDTVTWDKTPGAGLGKGSLWAIPINEEGYALFYRKDLFAAQNLTVPKTWPELYELATKLNGTEWAGQKLKGFVGRGMRTWPTINSSYGTIFSAYGGKELDANMKCAINAPEGVAATELWGKIMRETAPSDVIDYEWYQAQEYFAGGKAAMYIDADHMAEAFENSEKSQVAGKVGYALPPGGPNGQEPASNLLVFGYVMSKASKNQNATWLWMQWMSKKDVLVRTALIGNINPTRASVAKAPEVLKYMETWDYLPTMVTLLDKYAKMRWLPMKETPQIGDRWALAVQEVINDSKPAQQALDEACKDIDAIVQKAGYVK